MVSFKSVVGHATVALFTASALQAGLADFVSIVRYSSGPVRLAYKPVSPIKSEYRQASKSDALEFALSDLIPVL